MSTIKYNLITSVIPAYIRRLIINIKLADFMKFFIREQQILSMRILEYFTLFVHDRLVSTYRATVL